MVRASGQFSSFLHRGQWFNSPRFHAAATRFWLVSGHLATILTSKMSFLAMVTIWPALEAPIWPKKSKKKSVSQMP